MFGGVARRGTQPLAIEGFGQKIESPLPHRLNGHINRAMSGDHHHGTGNMAFIDETQDLHAGNIGQLQIQQDHLG